MIRSVHLSLSATLLMLATSAACAAEIDFAHDIVPVLRKQCGNCHMGGEKKGGFSMNTRESLLAGGESGKAVQPGKSAESDFIARIKSEDPDLQMPPEGSRLPAKSVEQLKRWVDEGLPWEPGFTFAGNNYEPPLRPRRPEMPPVREGRTNPVDRFVDSYLTKQQAGRRIGVSDATFIRRVYSDVIGLLPSPDQLQAFLEDNRADKREALIRELLESDIAYAEHWLTFWNDLLRNDYTGTGFITKGRTQITGWLHESLVENKPYDQLVRELLVPTAASEGFIRGIRWRGNVSASQRQEIQFAQNVSQVFLGINMKCASCHDSFIDRWTLEETYALAAIYASEPLTLHRCDKPIDKQAKAAWIFPELGDVDASAPQGERMQQLAALMTHPENGRFTRTIVNRIWHRLMGRGIVHPVDAMHTAPWDADLLDYLAVHLADNGYDLKKTIEIICTSDIYQAHIPANPTLEEAGPYVFRGPAARRMTAEQFVDAVWQVTGGAPQRYDAQVVRHKKRPTEDNDPNSPSTSLPKVNAKWIWSNAAASGPTPAGETITLRFAFQLDELPHTAIAAITCDNSYTLYVNGKQAGKDESWETVEIIPLQPYLRRGKNTFLVIAGNGGGGPNPAGFVLQAMLRSADGTTSMLGSDGTWEWTSRRLDQRGRFKKEPDDWKPAVAVQNQNVWAGVTSNQIVSLLASGNAPSVMVRASLVKSDFFMRALGRPNRDQIVTSRPSVLTTLEAIELANGQTLADAITSGARQRLAESPQGADQLTRWLFRYALSREPTKDERNIAREMLGEIPSEEAVQDIMWSIFMLPEFQLVR